MVRLSTWCELDLAGDSKLALITCPMTMEIYGIMDLCGIKWRIGENT